MASRVRWATSLLLLVSGVEAAEPAAGFQRERRVRQGTALDWQFAAGKGAKLPREHDSRRVRYQLFVPEGYKATKTWPLIVFVSPGDAPLAWKHWSGLCEKSDVLFCVAYAAGNDCPEAQRFRIVCDVLDDVRRDYRIDPDRTYLAGRGGGAAVAFRLAAALPETFGGVILVNGDGPLPRLDHSLLRLSQRLSVAVLAGEKEATRARAEEYFAPLLTALGVRSKFWLARVKEGEHPEAATLEAAFGWLEEDRKRRQADTKENGGSGLALAASVLEQARAERRDARNLFRAAAKLEWVTERYVGTTTARKAKELLDELNGDEEKKRQLTAQRDEQRRKVLAARARALEKFGRTPEARRAWLDAARLGPAAQREQAEAEAKRLAGVLAAVPYLGLTFEGETTKVKATAPGGPARLAGLRTGDRVEMVGADEADSPSAVRKLLAAKKPGEGLVVRVRRDGKVLKLPLTVGSAPVD